jgi:hypothetical protein
MRKVVVGLLFLTALLAGADVVFRLWSESTMAERIDEALGLPRRPELDLHGFPFSLQVLRSRFDRVEVEMEGLHPGGMDLATVRLDLRDVRFPRDRLFGPGPGTVRASTGTGSVEVTDEAFTEYLRTRGIPLTIRFEGPQVRASAIVSVAGVQTEVEATSTLEVEDGALAFRPEEIEVAGEVEVPVDVVTFRIPLPQPVPGVTLDRLTVGDGMARLTGDIEDLTFRLR